MKKNILKNNNGFTLIELIVSIAILSFAVVGFLNLFVYSTSYVAQARQKSNTSAETQTMANESINSNIPTEGSTIINKTLTLHPKPNQSSDITVAVTEITVTSKNRNQTSEIVAIIP
jgi:prepilin-type N-terminal cleavage/methylation domain-containing protein